MNKLIKLGPCALVFLVVACLDEGRFGEFDQAQVLAFGVEGEIAPAQILSDDQTIQLSLPKGDDGQSVLIKTLQLSSLAQASQQIGDTIDVSDGFELLVTAENGTRLSWTVELVEASGGLGGSQGVGGEGGAGDCPSSVLSYSITGLFEVSDTPANAGNGQFVIGPGSMTLRAQPDGLGKYRMTMLQYSIPQKFVVDAPGAQTTTDLDVSTTFDACGLASGTMNGTTLVWDTCDYGPAPPHGTIEWAPDDVVGGPGCMNGYHVQGTVSCAGAFCSAAGIDFPLQVDDNYPQPLNSFLFSADFSTFSMRAQGGPAQGVGHEGVEVPSTEPSRTWLGLDGTLLDVSCEPAPSCD